MERNSSTTVIAVVLALIIGGLIGYFLGMQQGEAKAMAAYQAGATAPSANNMGTGSNEQAMEQDKMVGDDAEAMENGNNGTPMMDQMMVRMDAQNNSGQAGTATLSEEGGKVKVVLNLTGGDLDAPQPAHIHMGNCPKPSEVVYPLTNVVDGKSETMLNTTMADLKAKGALAINVHKSEAEIDMYTACGDVK